MSVLVQLGQGRELTMMYSIVERTYTINIQSVRFGRLVSCEAADSVAEVLG